MKTVKNMKPRKNTKQKRFKSSRRMIGIIQTTCCYIPQIRVWHEDRWIKTTSRCIMRKEKEKCLNRAWGRKTPSKSVTKE